MNHGAVLAYRELVFGRGVLFVTYCMTTRLIFGMAWN